MTLNFDDIFNGLFGEVVCDFEVNQDVPADVTLPQVTGIVTQSMLPSTSTYSTSTSSTSTSSTGASPRKICRVESPRKICRVASPHIRPWQFGTTSPPVAVAQQLRRFRDVSTHATPPDTGVFL